MNSFFPKIKAIGSYTPDRLLTNADLERMVETDDEWIVQRTGIRERRISAPEEYTSHLCIEAVKNLVDRYGVSLEDVDLLIVSTSTPDFTFPSTASLVQAHFDIPQTLAFDLSAACAGFVYGLHAAGSMLASGLHRKALVIGADALSKITDYTDRTTCILFGDAAGAVLLERESRGAEVTLLSSNFGSDGNGGLHLYRSGLASSLNGVPVSGDGKLVQNGREVYKFAVQTVPKGVSELLKKAGKSTSDVDWFVPHSANLRIIESVCERTGIPMDKTLHTIERFGNTSAATIPLALDQGVKQGLLKEGDNVLMYGFGGGFVHGGLLMKWSELGSKE
ncbi:MULTISPECIES: ketoacyl-ACP synthase III [unclassified Paenibacillus]|uniref:ketoacyl-ACP synthase III n=1 Tax=unclassified Paenibacillus TaxID=185978 RepID=UPI001AE1817C|nr:MULTISPECIES: ketoacyl-ACP synthase III [unclassified Paenibacillus]MBP1156656.1 3-oxoacyl-[acyl-carrier-protein] synthase-3 [Paenibacillus sp. PvP091]MBP1172606.1 3-oxoacyl-[acyl-carrier-protein] synthase-3 [Paenibacillus sp. PvR098]MBP2438986.1 3-oxoacyl-[acyl-carrier-protein] synthase-3 [Paenibacillus sp. PvP052]